MKSKPITNSLRLGYMLAGFEMAHKIVKEWLPTEGRTGSLMVSLEARECAIRLEAEKAGLFRAARKRKENKK